MQLILEVKRGGSEIPLTIPVWERNVLRELRPGSGHWHWWCVVTWADHTGEGPVTQGARGTQWKWCEAKLSALPGRWCLPHGIYRCQHPRETILNNLSSSLQSGEMSPGHLEIADWQLPFLGLSRSAITYLQLSQLCEQGLSSYRHIFIISSTN